MFFRKTKYFFKFKEYEVCFMPHSFYLTPTVIEYKQTKGWSKHFLWFAIMKPNYLKPDCNGTTTN
jgi:hypothetical protein